MVFELFFFKFSQISEQISLKSPILMLNDSFLAYTLEDYSTWSLHFYFQILHKVFIGAHFYTWCFTKNNEVV